MKFLLGIAAGAIGMWAYKGGKLDSIMGNAPEPMQQAFTTATERFNQAAANTPLRDVASSVQDKLPTTERIVVPSASEVATRPSEPLPRNEPEDVRG